MADTRDNVSHMKKHHGEKAARILADRTAANNPRVADRFGRILTEGDAILHQPPILPVYCDLVEIKRVLDPRAPTGTIEIVMVATFSLHLHEGGMATSISQVFPAAMIAEARAAMVEQAGEPGQGAEQPQAPEEQPAAGSSGIVLTDADAPPSPQTAPGIGLDGEASLQRAIDSVREGPDGA